MQSTMVIGNASAWGLGLAAVTLGASAAANNRRRQQAADDATPRWRPVEEVDVHASIYGAYVHGMQTGFRPVGWAHVPMMELLGPRIVAFAWGPEHLMLESDLAELLTCCWAAAMKPDHPVLHTDSWLPDGFAEHCASCGYGVPLGPATERRNELGNP
jgi:hypothetical protein